MQLAVHNQFNGHVNFQRKTKVLTFLQVLGGT